MICWTHNHAWADSRNTYNCLGGTCCIQEPDFSGCFVLSTECFWLSLKLWGAEGAQSIAEGVQHLTALGTGDQNLAGASFFMGTLRKMASLFPCSGAGLTPSCAHATAWLFAVEEKQGMTRRTPWAPLCSGLPLPCHQMGGVQWSTTSANKPQPISLVCHELLLSSPAACVSARCMNMLSACQEGGLVMEHPGVGGFPSKRWGRKMADPWDVSAQSSVPLYGCTVPSFAALKASSCTHFIRTCNRPGRRTKECSDVHDKNFIGQQLVCLFISWMMKPCAKYVCDLKQVLINIHAVSCTNILLSLQSCTPSTVLYMPYSICIRTLSFIVILYMLLL